MKKLLLSLGLFAIAMPAMAQSTAETKVANIKNTRITVFYEDDEMTLPVTRLDDQTLMRNIYDKNGNKVLESEYHYANPPFYYHTAYWYNQANQVVADSTDNTKNFYGYYDNGNMKYKTKYKTDTGLMSDSTYYEYDGDNLIHEIIFNSSLEEKSRYRYTYEGNRLIKREYITGLTSKGDEKISRRVEYSYNQNGNLTEEIEYTLSTTVSSLGTIRSATRFQYTYDSLNRKIDQVYSEATASGGMLSSYTNKKKTTFEYIGQTGDLYKQVNHLWDPNNKIFVENDYDIYTYDQYSEARTPQNFSIEQGEKATEVVLNFDTPAETSNLKGYGLIINDKFQEAVYESAPIVLNKQVRGTHSYRVFALYDTVPGNVSNQLSKVIDITLPAPSNARVLTQEYTSQWVVTFAFDAPTGTDGLTPTGYRYVVTGGNGGDKGTISSADMTKGTFKVWYLASDKEANLVTVDLYAVYEEGESNPYTFQVDLRDTSNQIVAHWHQQNAEKLRMDEFGWENPVEYTNYYYTSSNTSNTESLIAEVINTFDEETYSYVPKYRKMGTTTEMWNAETMQWNNYLTSETKKEGTSMDYQMVETTKQYNAATETFEPVSIKIDKYHLDENYVPYLECHDWTKYYDVVDGQQIYTEYVVHTIEGYNKVDYHYATDQVTINKKMEYIYDVFGKLHRINTYKFEGGEYILTSYVENTYDMISELVTESATYGYADEVAAEMTMLDIVRYTASKEYHYIKMPFGLNYKNGTLKWSAPSTANINPDTYKVFVNNIFFTETTETSIEVEGLPTGKYTFAVMATFEGFESSLSASINANVVNNATFIPESVSPTPYDYELENSIDKLETVTLVFPSTVASITEGMEATLNSRFMGYPTTVTIAEDGKTVVFTLPADLENGFYSLDIPSKMFNAEDATYNPSLSYSFSLMLPLTTDLPAPTPDPAVGNVKELSVINLSFDRDVYALETLIGVPGHVYAEDSNGNRTDATINLEGWDYTKWTLTFANAITTPGTYKVVIPEATFGDSTASSSGWTGAFTTGKVNALIDFEYTIVDAAVDSISLDNQIRINGNSIIIPEGAKVYTTAGYEVNPSNLPAGIYVVNFNNQVAKVIIR